MSEHEQTKSLLSNEERRELIKQQRAEIERLHEEKQRQVDYWGKRAEGAEADRAELLVALKQAKDGLAVIQRIMDATIAKMEGK